VPVVNPGAMANSIDGGAAPAPVEAFEVESDARVVMQFASHQV
jgi:hypothetical protein